MIRKTSLYLLFSITTLSSLTAQEIVTGLQSNYPVVREAGRRNILIPKTSQDTLELPFFDDFSGSRILPDSSLWSDDHVFINNTYSDKQVTKGIATFDALNYRGRLYETASPAGFVADYLTSRPINLAYDETEDIWFSFFYQGGGLGDPPEINDSLTLQFLDPDTERWYSVWRTEEIDTQYFRPVIIKIDGIRFLKKGFRFRFVNYASLSNNLNDPSLTGNCDIWNVDYILLDRNRNAGDTIFNDVAFKLPLRSLLKNHEAIPWNQFQEIKLKEMGASLPVSYRNNDTITRNVTRNFEIWDAYKDTTVSFSAGASNIDPLSDVLYNADLFYSYNTDNNDSALFRITCSLKTDEFDFKGNDTLVYYQQFSNYFAFDDGSSEGGYGINGLGSSNAMVAYRFESFIPDTLRAIQICFNDSYLNANKRSFDLVVWNNDNGLPGEEIFHREEVMVEQGDMINGFYTYHIPEGVRIDGVFYIGWKQRSETFLNAGFDVNTSHAGRQMYWLNGDWSVSQVEGSLMIRPVVGSPLNITSVNEQSYSNFKKIEIWPNPAYGFINIRYDQQMLPGNTYISITDLNGRILINTPLSDRIDVSSLKGGLYIIIATADGRPTGYNRLIIAK